MSKVKAGAIQLGKPGQRIPKACRFFLLVTIILALSAAGLASGSSVKAAVPATASLSPSTVNVAEGQIFAVTISLNGACNLYTAEAHLAFDKDKLQVTDIQPGTLLTPSSPAGILKKADNSAGTIYYAATLTRPDKPVSDNGTLATINFKATSDGTAIILFKNPLSGQAAVKLADADGNPIPVDIQATPVSIAVTNSPPGVKNVTASQGNGTGMVNISYDLSDESADSVNVSFQFWNGTQWADCQSTTGEGATSTGTGKGGTWNAKADFDNQYGSGLKIKVVGDDGETINNVGEGESPTFTLDTKAPANVGCSLPQHNAADVPVDTGLAAVVAADDSLPIAYQFRLAEDQSFSSGVKESGWLTGSTWSPGVLDCSKTYWWAVQARDAYGNSSGWSSAFSFTTSTQGRILAQKAVSPTSETTVATEDGNISITLPAGAVATEADLIIREQPSSGAPSPPKGFKVGTKCFTIEMTQDLAPGVVVTIVMKYSDEDVEAAGGDPNLLTLAYYDETAEDWVVLDTVVDTDARTLTAQTDHFSVWMILAKTKGGGPPVWTWIVIGLGATMVAAGASTVWLRRRRPATVVEQATSDQSMGVK